MKQILAVAQHTLRGVVRAPGFRLFVLALVALAYFLPRIVPSDDLLGRLRLVVAYGLGVPAVLLGVSTLVFATGSVAREIEGRHVMLLASRPVPRWTILLGKVVGVVGVDVLLLGAVVLVGVANLASAPGGGSDAARQLAEERFWTPRREILPRPAPVDEERLERLVAEEAASPDRARARSVAELERRARRALQTRRVPVGATTTLRFDRVEVTGSAGGADRSLLVRYRFLVSPPTVLEVDTTWRLRGAGGERVVDRRISSSIPEVFELDASVVGPDGSLTIELANSETEDPVATLVLAPEAISVLSPTGTFWLNLGRALLVLVGQLAFVAVLGASASAFFSLPTANLLAFTVYIGATASGFLRDSLEAWSESASGATAGGSLAVLATGIASRVLELAPDVTAAASLGRVVDGRLLPPGGSLLELGVTVILYAGGPGAVAAWYWTRREWGGASS